MTGPAMASYRRRTLVWGGAVVFLGTVLGCAPSADQSHTPPAQAAPSAPSPPAHGTPTQTPPGPVPASTAVAQQGPSSSPDSDQSEVELQYLRKEVERLQQQLQEPKCEKTSNMANDVQTCIKKAQSLLKSAGTLNSGDNSDSVALDRSRLQTAAADLNAPETFHGFGIATPALWWHLGSIGLTVLSWGILVSLFLKTQQSQKANAEVNAVLSSIKEREEEAGAARQAYERLREKYEALSAEVRMSQLAEESMRDEPSQDVYAPERDQPAAFASSQPAASPTPARVDRYAPHHSGSIADSSVLDYPVTAEATPAKYAPIPMQETVPVAYQSTGDPLADYNHARSLGSADGGDWFRGKHSSTPLSCRNLGELKLNPSARLVFERAGRGDFLALDHNGRMLVFPAFSVDLASSRAFLEGVFRYADGGTPRVARAAAVEASGGEWILQQPGEIAGG